MSKLVQAFPQVRLAIYGIASATLAGLVIAGVVTEGQSSNILNYVGLGLGALATLLAGLNVPKAPAAESAPSASASNGYSVNLPGGFVEGLPAVVFREASQTVDQIRAQLEQQLGRRSGD